MKTHKIIDLEKLSKEELIDIVKVFTTDYNIDKNTDQFEIDYTFMFLYPEAQYPNHPEFVKQILSGDYNAKQLYAMMPKDDGLFDFGLNDGLSPFSNNKDSLETIMNNLTELRKNHKDLQHLREERTINLTVEELKNHKELKNIVSEVKKIDENNIIDFKPDELYPVKNGMFFFNEEKAKEITETGKKLIKDLEKNLEKNNKFFQSEDGLTVGMETVNNHEYLLNLDEAIFIGKPNKCSECNHNSFQSTDAGNQQFAVNYLEVLTEYRNDIKKFNINEEVSFIPNAEGIKLIYKYFNRYAEGTKYEYTLEMILNKIDLETGQYKMQMWDFVNCFGGHFKMGFEGPFKENYIYIHNSKLN